ncbi:hypothetical protein V8E51_007199 [Hyaloscypha variabilis]
MVEWELVLKFTIGGVHLSNGRQGSTRFRIKANSWCRARAAYATPSVRVTSHAAAQKGSYHQLAQDESDRKRRHSNQPAEIVGTQNRRYPETRYKEKEEFRATRHERRAQPPPVQMRSHDIGVGEAIQCSDHGTDLNHVRPQRLLLEGKNACCGNETRSCQTDPPDALSPYCKVVQQEDVHEIAPNEMPVAASGTEASLCRCPAVLCKCPAIPAPVSRKRSQLETADSSCWWKCGVNMGEEGKLNSLEDGIQDPENVA